MRQQQSATTIRKLIAEKEAAEQELRRQIQIMDHIKDAVISTDLSGVIRSWNRGAHLLFGFSPEQAVGRHISSILPEEPGAFSFNSKFVSRLVTDEGYRREIEFRRKSGLPITCQASFFPVNDDGCGS